MSDQTRGAQLSISQANLFSLSGSNIHVEYSSTSINGQPRLAYHDPLRNLSFAGSDIRTVDVPDIGTIVSVTLTITVDVGSTTFSVFIPHALVSAGRSDPVTTEAITTIHRMPFGPQLPGATGVVSRNTAKGVARQVFF
jgi:hypothetical protein